MPRDKATRSVRRPGKKRYLKPVLVLYPREIVLAKAFIAGRAGTRRAWSLSLGSTVTRSGGSSQ
jgi:hypothetical protein